MLKNPWLRLGALFALLLLLAVPLAYAKTIIVDGNPADWAAAPAQGSLITDPNEVGITDSADIGAIYFTNDSTNLYYRFDTYAGSDWSNAANAAVLCLNTDNNNSTGSTVAACNNQMGIDYVMDFRRSGAALSPLSLNSFQYCAAGACNSATSTGIVGARQLPDGTGTVTELGVLLSRLRLTSTGTAAPNGLPTSCTFTVPCLIGTVLVFDISGGGTDDVVSFTASLPIVPTPVTLTSFTATRGDGGVELAWATSSELNIQGFQVLRSAAGRAAAAPISAALIPGTGSGITGGSYYFTDATATAGSSYSYWLEVINSDGTPEEYGPVSYGPGTAQRTSVYLPLIVR